jgi:prefoldin subunit 5
VLGLVGRLEYLEQSMESVNAHRLQINETLFRLQENIEALQSSLTGPGGGP